MGEQVASELDTAREMIALLKRDNQGLLVEAEAAAIELGELSRERDKLRDERNALRATLVRMDHDLSGLRGDLDLARDLCEAVERWTGSSFPEDGALIGDIREAAASLRDALDRRA